MLCGDLPNNCFSEHFTEAATGDFPKNYRTFFSSVPKDYTHFMKVCFRFI